MELENSFHKLFFTKKGWIGIGRMMLTTLAICTIMCAIECTAVYALEVTRFEGSAFEHSMTGYVWGRDFGIAIACAWPLSWVLSNFIPVFWVRHVFEPAAKKSGQEPNKIQKIMGFVTITFCIALSESLLMSLIMYSVDTQVVVPAYMKSINAPVEAQNIPWVGKYWARVWGSALGISFGAALIVTSLVPMLMKKFFVWIDKKPFQKSDVAYNETDLLGKAEYFNDDKKDTDTLNVKKDIELKKSKQENSKRQDNEVSK